MSVSDAETGGTFTWGDTWNAPGDYPDAVLQIGFARDSDDGLVTEAAEIPIHLSIF